MKPLPAIHEPAIHEIDDRPGVFELEALAQLARDPDSEVRGAVNGSPYSARIALPRYGARIAHYFRDVAPGGLPGAIATSRIPFDLDDFGLIVHFEQPAEIAVHGDHMILDDSLRALVDRFGPVVLRNASMVTDARNRFHRNIFPHLRFHVDRGPAMPNQYSCFTRDPLDAEHFLPRESSTLFIANIVACLEQARATGSTLEAAQVGASSDLFPKTDMAPLLGEIIFEQPWNEPAGVGEIALIDNRTVLHATYHKDGSTRGYPIGARYLV